MSRGTRVVLAFVLLVPASAGASGTARPPVALTATPARVSLTGSSRAAIRVANTGVRAVVVDVARAGFSLDLRGHPKIVPRDGARAAVTWLTVRPRRLVLPAGATRSLVVSSRLPRRVEPGDHDALVLLTTRPFRRAGVAVRMRLGVVVVVRAPGRVVRRLELRALKVRRVRSSRLLELLVANRGNVTETLERGRVVVWLRRGTTLERVRADAREVRPRTSGLVQLRYRGRLRGWVSARAVIAAQPGGRTLARTFRIRL